MQSFRSRLPSLYIIVNQRVRLMSVFVSRCLSISLRFIPNSKPAWLTSRLESNQADIDCEPRSALVHIHACVSELVLDCVNVCV